MAVASSHYRRNKSTNLIDQIESHFNHFSSKTPDQAKGTVIVEGFDHGTEGIIWDSYKQAIEEAGESGATFYLAQQKGYKVISPEIPESELKQKLSDGGFEETDIEAFFAVRSLAAATIVALNTYDQ